MYSIHCKSLLGKASMVSNHKNSKVISSEHTDLPSADHSQASHSYFFFGWRGKTGNEATIIFLIEESLGPRKFE